MLADLAPTPLAMAVQVSCSLVTTVLSGVVIASQEFRLQSLVYFSGLVLVFTPIVLIVANAVDTLIGLCPSTADRTQDFHPPFPAPCPFD